MGEHVAIIGIGLDLIRIQHNGSDTDDFQTTDHSVLVTGANDFGKAAARIRMTLGDDMMWHAVVSPIAGQTFLAVTVTTAVTDQGMGISAIAHGANVVVHEVVA